VTILVELGGLEVFGRHGLLPEERTGQTFLYDVEVETSEAALSDRIEDAVDYREVAELVRVVSDRTRYDRSSRSPLRSRTCCSHGSTPSA
jgi:dihydroneopterin aldolase